MPTTTKEIGPGYYNPVTKLEFGKAPCLSKFTKLKNVDSDALKSGEYYYVGGRLVRHHSKDRKLELIKTMRYASQHNSKFGHSMNLSQRTTQDNSKTSQEQLSLNQSIKDRPFLNLPQQSMEMQINQSMILDKNLQQLSQSQIDFTYTTDADPLTVRQQPTQQTLAIINNLQDQLRHSSAIKRRSKSKTQLRKKSSAQLSSHTLSNISVHFPYDSRYLQYEAAHLKNELNIQKQITQNAQIQGHIQDSQEYQMHSNFDQNQHQDDYNQLQQSSFADRNPQRKLMFEDSICEYDLPPQMQNGSNQQTYQASKSTMRNSIKILRNDKINLMHQRYSSQPRQRTIKSINRENNQIMNQNYIANNNGNKRGQFQIIHKYNNINTMQSHLRPTSSTMNKRKNPLVISIMNDMHIIQ